MEEKRNLPVLVSHRSISNLSYNTQLAIKDLSTEEKTKNGFKYLGFSLLAALLFVFIPMLHFVLVPSAILVGVFLFYKQMGYKESMLENKIHCPDCKAELKLKPSPFHWPLQIICDKCHAQILITLAANNTND